MAITTWINDNERATWSEVKDAELNELFQEVRNKISKRFLVSTHAYYKKPWFRKGQWIFSYTLYIDIGHEAQVFNFPPESGSSINTGISKAKLMTYFYGVINGYREGTEKHLDKESTPH